MCTVLGFLAALGDNKVSISCCHLLWTSAKPWSPQELSAAPSFMVCKTLLLFKHQPNYGSGSPVFLEGPPYPWNLAAPKSICCALPANAEVVLACFTLRSKVFIRVMEKTKVPPHALLLILFSIFNCFHKMLPGFGSCCWGSSSNASGFAQAQGRRVQDMAIGLMKAFKFGWIKIISLGFSQNKSTGRVGEGGLRQTAMWRTEGHT